MQLLQEWNIEDNIRLQEAIRIVQNYHNNIKDEHLFATSGWCLSWLKSLKNRVQAQNTWKPSDEQLDTLHDAAVYVDKSMFPYPKGILMKLYEQLKKLREE